MGKDEVRTKVATGFPDLDLTFLDEELEVEDEHVLEAEGLANPQKNSDGNSKTLFSNACSIDGDCLG